MIRAESTALMVSGATSDQSGDIAATHGVVSHELSTRRGSLGTALPRLTGEAVGYQTSRDRGQCATDALTTAGK